MLSTLALKIDVFLFCIAGPFKLPIIGNILCMIPAVLDSSKIKAHFTFNLDMELFEKYLSYKPAYILFDEQTRKYGTICSLQFGVNSAGMQNIS